MPRVGFKAPEVDADAYVRGLSKPQRVRSREYAGRWLALFFYPRDFTFVCPTELQEFARLHREFEAEDAIVVGSSTDSWFSHKAWYGTDARLTDVRYPVVADTSQQLAASYDVLLGDGSSQRGTFIIDPEGCLRHIYVNDDYVGRNVEESLRVLMALKTGERCPAGWVPGDQTLRVVDNVPVPKQATGSAPVRS